MNFLRIAARISSLSQPLSERRDYGTYPHISTPMDEANDSISKTVSQESKPSEPEDWEVVAEEINKLLESGKV